MGSGIGLCCHAMLFVFDAVEKNNSTALLETMCFMFGRRGYDDDSGMDSYRKVIVLL